MGSWQSGQDKPQHSSNSHKGYQELNAIIQKSVSDPETSLEIPELHQAFDMTQLVFDEQYEVINQWIP
ncbi:hypothetical protein PN466_05485 [Roseofilum reptotaenium CS-1145]|uniref:Uncharacterized protein n=1 Tax=Roseofilum reptotaenium AO1-A TaxID=1925591 RepID=A0A1L9QP35_9CYAN|nr:hypothetical protein [Roseofilum reptotaenium]MDB9516411.1 hypothetical protein [Roseofilum reptotaenium CS-1145]OJJ24409.1 hypothetical protein BI308_16495 [Roseofilum reptotaenium AO1-A]